MRNRLFKRTAREIAAEILPGSTSLIWESMSLLDTLVEKGLLSNWEAEAIWGELTQE